MIKSDFHMHTTFCDGRDTPEAMVRAGIALGMEWLGFSGHGGTDIPGDPGMNEETTAEYLREIARLRELYKDEIHIAAGIEWDYYSRGSREGFQYVIGSVHYFDEDPEAGVDNTPEILAAYVENRFGGDYAAAAELYFDHVAEVVDVTGADIIGHFDLITKFNEGDRIFDTQDPRYIAAWQKAADRLLRTGRPFEINTGAITRGYRTLPYPAVDIIDYIGARGGSFILSSDAHSASAIMHGFPELEAMLTRSGYRIVKPPVVLSDAH